MELAHYEQLVYNAAKIYVPVGTGLCILGIFTGNFEWVAMGYIVLLFVFYLYYTLYVEIQRQR